MYISMITIHPVSGDISRTIEMLDSMQGLTATNPDSLGCSLTVEAREGNSICYMERWLTRQALEKHLRSSLYSRVLEAMELSQVRPEIKFYEAREVGGLDFLEQVRLYSDSVTSNKRTAI